MAGKSPQRVMAYVDGFNLYYGLQDARFRRFLWLNVHALAGRLLRPNQELVATKYFTSRIGGGRPTDRPEYSAMRSAKRKRQVTYLEALDSVERLSIYYGQFREERVECNKCRAAWFDAEEKMTDVNIATEMIVDAFANRYDVALLISADSDLVPPIRAVRQHLKKRMNVAFPPSRRCEALKKAADGQCVIGRGTLKKSQFPDEVETPSGFVLKRPNEWS